MKKIVNLVAQKANISDEQARTAVNTVASFLKDKLPPGVAGQVDNYLNDEEGSAGSGDKNSGGMGGMADKVGGMFGKK